MPKVVSAGIISYYFDKDENNYKFLVCKPGGPYFKNKFVYGFPKGQVEENENLKQAAVREFLEETGVDVIDYRNIKDENIISIKTNSKNFYFYLYETPEVWETEKLKSNFFLDEKTNKYYPENDDFQWMTLKELKAKTFKYMDKAIEELERIFT